MSPKRKGPDIEALETKLRRTGNHPAELNINFGAEKNDFLPIYAMLVEKISRTRYWNEEAVNSMGIFDDLRNALQRIEVWQFFSQRCPTYYDLTLEFLSTLRVRRARRGVYPSSIQFRLRNQAFTRSTPEINRLFGSPPGEDGELYTRREEYDMVKFWKRIASTLSNPIRHVNLNNLRPTSIRNPTLRYFQKMLNHTLCFRAEGGAINQEELYILWCVVNGIQFDLGATFIEICEKMQSGRPSKIGVGGMITQLAIALGVEMTRNERIGEPTTDLDLIAITNVGMVKKIGETWCLKQNNGLSFPLIHPQLTTIFGGRANLNLDSAEHLAAIQAFINGNRRAAQVEDMVMPPPQRFLEDLMQEGREKRARRERNAGEGSSAPRMEEQAGPAWNFDEYECNRILARLANVETRLGRVEHNTRHSNDTYRIVRRMERLNLRNRLYQISDDEDED